MNSLGITFDKVSTNDINFVVGFYGDFVDEISDGKFCAFRQNVLNVFGSDEFALFYGVEDATLIFSGLEFLVFFVLLSLFEKKDLVGLNKKIDELSLLFKEKVSVFVFEHDHFLDFFLIIVDCVVSSGPVDDKQDSFLDIFKGFEGLVQIPDELG
jgi:hypothetical protein